MGKINITGFQGTFMSDDTIVCSDCNKSFEPPKWVDLSGTGSGGALGALGGSSLGIVGFGTGIAATGPAAVLGGLAGYAASKKVTRCTECGKIQTR